MQINNKVAMVTGAASGLGEATARRLAREGAKVGVLDRDIVRAESVAKDIGGLALTCDVTDEKAAGSALAALAEWHEIPSIVVNCAGIGQSEKVISGGKALPFANHKKVIDTHLNGTFNVIRLAAEQMIRRMPDEQGQRGVFVNTSSISGIEGQIGAVSYAAAKAGIAGMTLPLAREFSRYGIRVVAIAPGLFETPMVGELRQSEVDKMVAGVPFPHRFGRPEEYARLARDIIENPMLNGEIIRLDAAFRIGGL